LNKTNNSLLDMKSALTERLGRFFVFARTPCVFWM
jgi:hypothetical protein